MPLWNSTRSKKTSRGWAGDDVKPNRGHHEAKQDREDGLGNVVAAQANKRGECQKALVRILHAVRISGRTRQAAGAKSVNSTIDIVAAD